MADRSGAAEGRRRYGSAQPIADPEIVLDRTVADPLYRQIAEAFRREIASGLIPEGTRLPPERELARRLGVDRSTVVSAYRVLVADGWASAHVGRGTIAHVPVDREAAAAGTLERADLPAWFDWEPSLTSHPSDEALLDELAPSAARPDLLSLASSVPATTDYPLSDFREVLDQLLRPGGESLLQYAPTEGLPELRSSIAERMRRRESTVNDHGIVVTAGSQQALYLLARTLVVPGDTVAVEAPTYLGAIGIFRAADAHLVTMPRDREGVDPLRLDAMLERRRVKLLYLLPTYQNPTGASLSVSRRRQILAVAARHRVPIIEDDPYGDLRYDGERFPTMFELAGPTGGVAYVSTFSKVLFPGFRVGWIAGASPLIERVRREKALVDLDSNAVVQAAVARYLERGLLDAHLDLVRPAYRARRDTLVAALTDGLFGQATWSVPSGGFSLWLELESGLLARDVLADAVNRGVTFVPGELFHVDGGGRSSLRLSFSSLPPDQIAIAARRLCEAIRVVAGRRARRGRRTPIV